MGVMVLLGDPDDFPQTLEAVFEIWLQSTQWCQRNPLKLWMDGQTTVVNDRICLPGAFSSGERKLMNLTSVFGLGYSPLQT